MYLQTDFTFEDEANTKNVSYIYFHLKSLLKK